MTCAICGCADAGHRLRDALRDRYDAGDSLVDIARDQRMSCEDVFALICYARDLDRKGKPAPRARDTWRVSLTSST